MARGVRDTVKKRQTSQRTIVGWTRGGRDTVKNHGAPTKTTVPAENGQVGPTSENVQRRRAYSRVGARWSGNGENHGAAANTTESAKNG